MARTTTAAYYLSRLLFGMVAAIAVFMIESAPQRALAGHDVVYVLSRMEILPDAFPPS